MFLTDTNYPCPLSIVAFGSIVESLNSEVNPCFLYSESNIAFVDGDSADIPSMVKSIYDLRKENKVVYTITFLSKGNECSTVIRHLSDLVVDKQIRYAALENLVRMMVASEPKALADNVFGDIWGDLDVFSERTSSIETAAGRLLPIPDSKDAAFVDKDGQWL
ncbi:hypothetical protein ACQ86O_07885 [Serratia sp. L9]|uniref:hypothetical protein n=1 Tax=Serratia sp. L9 TaxID=3423946 RepID=UPI003D6780E3